MQSNISKALLRKKFSQIESPAKPEWIKIKIQFDKINEIKRTLKSNKIVTVCEEAMCPNMSDCWAKSHATFMILGNICTRSCKFCGVKTGKPLAVAREEAEKVANSIKIMQIKHAVLTSVDRDDLKDDMGSKFWVETINKIREYNPGITLEDLKPDYQGIKEHIDRLVNGLID